MDWKYSYHSPGHVHITSFQKWKLFWKRNFVFALIRFSVVFLQRFYLKTPMGKKVSLKNYVFHLYACFFHWGFLWCFRKIKKSFVKNACNQKNPLKLGQDKSQSFLVALRDYFCVVLMLCNVFNFDSQPLSKMTLSWKRNFSRVIENLNPPPLLWFWLRFFSLRCTWCE